MKYYEYFLSKTFTFAEAVNLIGNENGKIFVQQYCKKVIWLL